MDKVTKVRHLELQYYTPEELAKLFNPPDPRMRVWNVEKTVSGKWCIELGFNEERSDPSGY